MASPLPVDMTKPLLVPPTRLANGVPATFAVAVTTALLGLAKLISVNSAAMLLDPIRRLYRAVATVAAVSALTEA